MATSTLEPHPSRARKRKAGARKATMRKVPARMTLAQFHKFDTNPDEKWELIEGRPFMSPSARYLHQTLARILCNFIETVLTDDDGWMCCTDTSVIMPKIVTEVRPDVASYRTDEVRDLHEIPLHAVPRLAIEVASPSTFRNDFQRKLRAYRKAGVPEYWIVDPQTGAVNLYVLTQGKYIQQSVDSRGFIASPLLGRTFRIAVHPRRFEILEAS